MSVESGLADIPRVVGQFAKGVTQVPANIADVVMRNAKSEDFTSLEKLGFKPNAEQEERLKKLKSLTTERAPRPYEKIEELAGKPKTAIGKQLGGYAETLGSMLSPIPGVQGIGLAKAAKQAGVGQIAKWASQQIGFGERGSDRFKLASMVMYTLLGRKGPLTEASQIYNEGKKHLPKSLTASTGPLKKIGEELEKNFDPTIMRDAKSQQTYNKLLDNFRDLTDTSKVPVANVWEFKKKIPEMVDQASKYSNSAANPFYELSDKLSQWIKSHPDVPVEARKAIKIGDELWSGYSNITKTYNTVKDAALKFKTLSAATLGILGIKAPALAALAAAGVGAKTAYSFVKEFLTNPSIQHHYTKTMQLAAREAKGPLLKELALLNQAVEKVDKKKKLRK